MKLIRVLSSIVRCSGICSGIVGIISLIFLFVSWGVDFGSFWDGIIVLVFVTSVTLLFTSCFVYDVLKDNETDKERYSDTCSASDINWGMVQDITEYCIAWCEDTQPACPEKCPLYKYRRYMMWGEEE